MRTLDLNEIEVVNGAGIMSAITGCIEGVALGALFGGKYAVSGGFIGGAISQGIGAAWGAISGGVCFFVVGLFHTDDEMKAFMQNIREVIVAPGIQ